MQDERGGRDRECESGTGRGKIRKLSEGSKGAKGARGWCGWCGRCGRWGCGKIGEERSKKEGGKDF